MIATSTQTSVVEFDASVVVVLLREADAALERGEHAVLELKLSASSSRAREAGRAADEALEDAKEALLRAKLSIPASSSLLHDAARERVLFFEQKRAALRARLDESTASWALPADEQTRELLQLRNVQLAQLQQQEGDAEFVLTLAQERNEDLRKIEADVAALSEMQTDMAMLLAVQQPMLCEAEEQIESSVAASSEAAKQLGEAEKAVNAARKRKFWLVVGVTVVVLTAGIGILAWRKIVA